MASSASHAGDGVTPSSSPISRVTVRRVRAAIDAAPRNRSLPLPAPSSATGSPSGHPINVGVHWSGALYLGQVVTGGRLEVTALGDEINECARIQQTARDGAVLASKRLVERLGPDDAAAVGSTRDRGCTAPSPRSPGATPKAIRDAGGVAVVAVPRRAT